MVLYEISEWAERYEVNEKGDIHRPGEKLRKRPLSWVRLAVHGHEEGIGWKRLRAVCGNKNVLATFGLFAKLLELAGDQTSSNRGKILNEKCLPADEKYMSLIWSIPEEDVSEHLKKLREVGWISEKEYETPEVSGKLRETPGVAGNSEKLRIPLYNRTEPNLTKLKLNRTEEQNNLDEYPVDIIQSDICTESPETKEISSEEISVSVSEKPIKSKFGFLVKIAEVFHIEQNSSNHSAFCNLCDTLAKQQKENPGIYNEVLALARDKMKSNAIRNPLGAFFADMKKTYGFVPADENWGLAK